MLTVSDQVRAFKKRYVLGEGYPWATGLGTPDAPYDKLCLCKASKGAEFMTLDFPEELWGKFGGPELPKYRIVLERVDD